MDISNQSILSFFKALLQTHVQYILVGGFATGLNGYIRTTEDIDIWIKDTLENRKKLRSAFKNAGVGDFPQLETLQIVAGWSSIRIGNGIEVDLITEIKGLEQSKFNEYHSTSPVAEIHGVEIKFLHINHLIDVKKTSNRPKDQLDVLELEKILKASSNS